jgi:hypothetical protein
MLKSARGATLAGSMTMQIRSGGARVAKAPRALRRCWDMASAAFSLHDATYRRAVARSSPGSSSVSPGPARNLRWGSPEPR